MVPRLMMRRAEKHCHSGAFTGAGCLVVELDADVVPVLPSGSFRARSYRGSRGRNTSSLPMPG